jgi:hypothetical protein
VADHAVTIARWLRSADCAFVALSLLAFAVCLAIVNLLTWRPT